MEVIHSHLVWYKKIRELDKTGAFRKSSLWALSEQSTDTAYVIHQTFCTDEPRLLISMVFETIEYSIERHIKICRQLSLLLRHPTGKNRITIDTTALPFQAYYCI